MVAAVASFLVDRRTSTRRSRRWCPIINMHHSFLLAFAGADPYARRERGVTHGPRACDEVALGGSHCGD
jgi:hypothetical protein